MQTMADVTFKVIVVVAMRMANLQKRRGEEMLPRYLSYTLGTQETPLGLGIYRGRVLLIFIEWHFRRYVKTSLLASIHMLVSVKYTSYKPIARYHCISSTFALCP